MLSSDIYNYLNQDLAIRSQSGFGPGSFGFRVFGFMNFSWDGFGSRFSHIQFGSSYMSKIQLNSKWFLFQILIGLSILKILIYA